MSDYAIQVENLGKKYRIGNHAPYARFTELLIGAAKAPFNIAKQKLAKPDHAADHASPSEFWALQDVNFTIAPGEIVGVIGRNGAGKSTLLKLLSRITEPTTGRIRYKGRVGSLLEVGTGFHPELTGRDNIFLNGAILGMTRAEVRKKFDEIVAFSEVEKFLDTAVKHYSSGMYMRLAFAVAAHLEPEILLVDEVLAVGDAEFQKKCLGKMGEVAREGRTILFVSHDIGAISRLCTNGLWLANGKCNMQGPVNKVIDSYNKQFKLTSPNYKVDLSKWRNRQCNNMAKFMLVTCMDENEQMTGTINYGQKATFILTFDCNVEIEAEFSAVCHRHDGVGALHISQYDSHVHIQKYKTGRHEISFSFDRIPLLPGDYYWDFGLHTRSQKEAIDVVFETMPFKVIESNKPSRPFPSANSVAVCDALCNWLIDKTMYKASGK